MTLVPLDPANKECINNMLGSTLTRKFRIFFTYSTVYNRSYVHCTDCSSVEDQELCRPDPDPTFGNVLTGSRSEFRKRYNRIPPI